MHNSNFMHKKRKFVTSCFEVLAPQRLNKNISNNYPQLNTDLLIFPKKGPRDSRGDNLLPQSGVQVVPYVLMRFLQAKLHIH